MKKCVVLSLMIMLGVLGHAGPGESGGGFGGPGPRGRGCRGDGNGQTRFT